jgi:hypothetical protein
MAIATIIYTDGHMQRLSDEDKATALEAYRGFITGAPEVRETVKTVILPPSWQPAGYRSRLFNDPFATSHLTNEGIYQSSYSAVPTGDR